MSRPLLLLTNDDGIRSSGLTALAEAASALGEVWTVAPADEQSATSHALTLHRPLRVREHGPRVFSVSGTPTDCVFLATLHLLPRRPDLVLSGINRGGNLGNDVSYSGTVSAALEAAIMGLPGIALSHLGYERRDYAEHAPYALEIAREVMRRGLPPHVYLNVNFPDVPAAEVKGVRVTTLGRRSYDNAIVERHDPRGRPYFWIGGQGFFPEDMPGSDCNAVVDGYTSVTALHARPFDVAADAALRAWGLERG